MKKLFLDSETVGLHSMPVLLQYALEDGPITLYDIWLEPVGKTLDLIESWLKYCIVGFNLSFDFFQLAKLYTIWLLLPRDWIPCEHIEEIALIEPEGRDGPCIKPAGALDLMLHSRKGEHQSLMRRDDIRIRKVPTALAYALAEELEERVELDGIYFAKRADKDAPRWAVYDRENSDGEFDTDFKDVVLRFSPAGGLKFLAEYAMDYMPKFHYKDVEPPKAWYPVEIGYAPFALAISTPEQNWEVWAYDKKKEKDVLKGHAWPACIENFINHWANNKNARVYAYEDIVITRMLDKYYKYPEPNDDDSILSTMVPVVRWRGFKINLPGMVSLRDKAVATVADSPVNINKPTEVRAYMNEAMDDMEKIIIEESTKKAHIEAIRNWKVEEDEECTKCDGVGCHRCTDGVLKADAQPCEPGAGNHPAAYRAKEILDIKIAAKEVELYNKLILAGRFHADFVVIGTKSTRMSGASGLNAQGIKATKEVRRCFPLAWDGFVLCGGDFDAFEVTLADAVYNDPALRRALIKKIPCPFCEQTKKCHKCGGTGLEVGEKCKYCKKRGEEEEKLHMEGSGQCDECDSKCMVRQKIHGLFGQAIFPGHTYAEILASSGTNHDMYLKGKSGVFAMIYGGNADTLVRNLGVQKEDAEAAFTNFDKAYPGVAKAREKIYDAFCSMRQPGGKHVIWKDPEPRVTSFLGFSRDFTLENCICHALFTLANKPPKGWRNHPVKVWRRDRVQTAGGAVASALYGASFGLQAANMRAAANHEIQSPGGQITKALQRAIWDLQPVGVHELVVSLLNIHDEIMCVTHPDYVDAVTEAARASVESFRPQVPLIGLTWSEMLDNWAEKKGGSVTINICAPEME